MGSKNIKKDITYNFKEEVGVIRDRNQITLPVEFKKIVEWIEKDTPVRLKLEDNKIVIEPIIPKKKKENEKNC